MDSGDKLYIWEQNDWPHLQYDMRRLAGLLAHVHRIQGHLHGRMDNIGMGLRERASLQAMSDDVIKSSEIEGEQLNPATVRSSIARRMGVDVGALAPADRHVDAIVDMMLDATRNYDQTLTVERLYGWHAALFPTGYSGLHKINVGAWRNDASGPMQVVSGPIGRGKIHYQAPPANRVDIEINRFLSWFNTQQEPDLIVKAGLAHLWFVTIHPFDDGNGRITRAIGDMALARAENSPDRFYSLSAQIQKERADYYDILERTQKMSLDVTNWLEWFLGCLTRAIISAEGTLDIVLAKARFWQHCAGTPMNDRQVKILNRLLDGFDGKLTNKKWSVIAKCSSDTALRDITDLLERDVLVKIGAGRSTSYELKKEI